MDFWSFEEQAPFSSHNLARSLHLVVTRFRQQGWRDCWSRRSVWPPNVVGSIPTCDCADLSVVDNCFVSVSDFMLVRPSCKVAWFSL